MANIEIHPSGRDYFRNDIQSHILIITLLLVFLIILVAHMLYHSFCQELRSSAYTDTRTTVFGVRLQARRAKPSPSGLDTTTINSLPVLIHRSSSGSGDRGTSSNSTTAFGQSECSICLGMFEDKEMVKIMPKCQHAFHCVCVDKWLRNQSTCPVCREIIVSCSETVSTA